MTIKKVPSSCNSKDTGFFRTFENKQYFKRIQGFCSDIRHMHKYEPQTPASRDHRFIDYFNPNKVKMENVMIKIDQDFHQFGLAPKFFSEVNPFVFDFFASSDNVYALSMDDILQCFLKKHGSFPRFEVETFPLLDNRKLYDLMSFIIALKYLCILKHCSKPYRDKVLKQRKPLPAIYTEKTANDSNGVEFYEWFVTLMSSYSENNLNLFLYKKFRNYKDICFPHVLPFLGFDKEDNFYKSSHPPRVSPYEYEPIVIGVKAHRWANDMELNLICLGYQTKKEMEKVKAMKAEMALKVSDRGMFRIFKHSNYGVSSVIHLRGYAIPISNKPRICDRDRLVNEIKMLEYSAEIAETSSSASAWIYTDDLSSSENRSSMF